MRAYSWLEIYLEALVIEWVTLSKLGSPLRKVWKMSQSKIYGFCTILLQKYWRKVLLISTYLSSVFPYVHQQIQLLFWREWEGCTFQWIFLLVCSLGWETPWTSSWYWTLREDQCHRLRRWHRGGCFSWEAAGGRGRSLWWLHREGADRSSRKIFDYVILKFKQYNEDSSWYDKLLLSLGQL